MGRYSLPRAQGTTVGDDDNVRFTKGFYQKDITSMRPELNHIKH